MFPYVHGSVGTRDQFNTSQDSDFTFSRVFEKHGGDIKGAHIKCVDLKSFDSLLMHFALA